MKHDDLNINAEAEDKQPIQLINDDVIDIGNDKTIVHNSPTIISTTTATTTTIPHKKNNDIGIIVHDQDDNPYISIDLDNHRALVTIHSY